MYKIKFFFDKRFENEQCGSGGFSIHSYLSGLQVYKFTGLQGLQVYKVYKDYINM